MLFWKNSTHQGTKPSQCETSCFPTKNFEICRNFTTWNPLITFPLRKIMKPWTLSFKQDTIRAKAVLPLKCLKESKMLRFTLQLKDLVFHFLKRTWDSFSEVWLAMNLEWCWEKKDLTILKLFTTLSAAYTLSCHIQTWLSTIFSVTQWLLHCVAFPWFQS